MTTRPLLTHEEVDAIEAAAFACRLEDFDIRDLLFADIPRKYAAELKRDLSAGAQLRHDLNELSHQPSLVGLDQPPLAIWLLNAERRAAPRPEAEVFARLRAKLVATPLVGAQSGPIVSTARLPRCGPHFVGRDAELALLEEAWRDPGTRVQSLVAWGGAGKTTLMRRWLNDLGQRGYDGAVRVYAWSFYSQGAGEGRQGSADLFVDQMLRWLGAERPEEGDPWHKGERLAGLIRRQKTLLLLDGVEPLQHPPGPMFGQLKDPTLKVLLTSLADQMDGLCVVSSRLSLTDLDGQVGGGYQPHDLSRLSAEAGAELLRRRGVRGSEDELREVAEEYGCHALALQLLGSYLAMYEKGDVHRKVAIRGLTEVEDGGEHARRVMRAYEPLLNPVDLAVLRLASIFDRAAEAKALAALRASPWIKGFTTPLKGMNHLDWRRAVAHLRQLGLLVETEGDGLDAHPLVREYFSAQLREATPKAWKAAHERMYRHFAAAAPDLPDTLEAMEPLFRAVVHGCIADRFEETRGAILWRRIRHGMEAYTVKRLGAFASDLATLAWFFVEPWSLPHPSLSEDSQAWVLGEAGFNLRALGRLVEAVAPTRDALNRRVQQRNWKESSGIAGNLSELLLALGRLEEAEALAHEAVTSADRTANVLEQMLSLTTQADVLFQRGRLEAARALFADSETMQAARQPKYPMLYSLQGYQFGDLLLSLDEVAEVRRRAMWMLRCAQQEGVLLDIALGHLLLGRADLADAINSSKPALAAQVAQHFEAAVAGLRKANQKQYQPLGFLSRAALHRTFNCFDLAHRDIDQAHQIADRCGMRLHLADCHLESARLHLAEQHLDAARRAYEIAKSEVASMGYHRRDPELAALAAALDPTSETP